MVQALSTSATTLLIGTGILVVGYLIKYRQWTGLISETTAVISPDTETAPIIASLIGNVTLVVGVFVLMLGGLQIIGLATLLPGWLVLVLLVGSVVLITPRLSLVLDSE